MKKLAFILLVISLNCNGENVIKNNTTYDLNNYISLCLKDMGIDSATIFINQNKGLICDKYYALTSRAESIYVITLSDVMTQNEALEIIAHELIHVKQFYFKELVIINDYTIQFKGKKYHVTNDSHFDDPQEKEAIKLGYKLFKKITA